MPDSNVSRTDRPGCDRLYDALAFFDTRDGTFEADVVRAAREGYERSAPEMSEPNAWAEFDRLMERHREAMFDA